MRRRQETVDSRQQTAHSRQLIILPKVRLVVVSCYRLYPNILPLHAYVDELIQLLVVFRGLLAIVLNSGLYY